MTAGRRRSLALACLLAIAAGGAQAEERADIWDVPFGIGVAELDARFVFTDYACGTAGGPPARRLDGFAGFSGCRPEAGGLHEVYFRYDDVDALMALALARPRSAAASAGTIEFDFPVIASLLIDADGVVRGKRLVTDPRPANATERPRFEFWTLGNLFRNRLSPAGWACADQPLRDGEHALASYVVKSECTLMADGLSYSVRQSYLQRRGQSFLAAASGRFDAEAFESTTWIEVVAPPGSAPQ